MTNKSLGTSELDLKNCKNRQLFKAVLFRIGAYKRCRSILHDVWTSKNGLKRVIVGSKYRNPNCNLEWK